MNKIKELFLNKKFMSFAVIGGINTVGAIALSSLFILMDVNVGMASLLGDTLTMILSYFLNMHYTYHRKVSWKSFFSFPLSYIPGIIIAMVITISINAIGAPKLLSKPLSLPITIPLNYILMSFVVKYTSIEKD